MVQIRLVDAEEVDRLQVYRHAVGDSPVQLQRQRSRGAAGVSQKAGDNFAAVDVVESQAGGEKVIVLEGI